ncbi:hypothetical protein ALP03_03243 [Pseudomonas amygdali pv. tabaci]|uniref:Uncharacterized protein n=1 Tax=Pseudomonas amygdali pv. tabaci TaxID=322 RepID=A0A3M6GW51_PSEAJ|nr:hypothetical protein ALP03_03243 [Pseudomonas amygdali pv. tabaci]
MTHIAFGAQQHFGLGVAQHLLQARIRGFDVQRHVHTTGLEDRQHRREPVQRTLHQHRNRLAFANTHPDQMMGQLIGGLIQLQCRQGAIKTLGSQCMRLVFNLLAP